MPSLKRIKKFIIFWEIQIDKNWRPRPGKRPQDAWGQPQAYGVPEKGPKWVAHWKYARLWSFIYKIIPEVNSWCKAVQWMPNVLHWVVECKLIMWNSQCIVAANDSDPHTGIGRSKAGAVHHTWDLPHCHTATPPHCYTATLHSPKSQYCPRLTF